MTSLPSTTCSRPSRYGPVEYPGSLRPWQHKCRPASRRPVPMDNTTILSWNVRGLNAGAWRDAVRTLVGDIRPTIVCLQETKLAIISQFLVSLMHGINFCDFAYLPASDTHGGIVGRHPEVSLSDVLIGCYSITMVVTPLT
jgi:hypothetical protein